VETDADVPQNSDVDNHGEFASPDLEAKGVHLVPPVGKKRTHVVPERDLGVSSPVPEASTCHLGSHVTRNRQHGELSIEILLFGERHEAHSGGRNEVMSPSPAGAYVDAIFRARGELDRSGSRRHEQ